MTHEIIGPSPQALSLFGSTVVVLPNGNIAVPSRSITPMGPHAGAVHLYNPLTQSLIASVFGDKPED